uniref:Uncharacterized protein n=1 Tax=Meloidogyne enterolobii TaxID=390850 RepID=A0A6V7V403_MELEN|nr:unnamed protein product [Meloidogyne enterolobii]
MGEIQEEGYDSDKEVPKRFSCFGFRCKRGVDGEDSFNLKYNEIVANVEMINGTFEKDTLVQVLMDMLTTEIYQEKVFKAFNYLHNKWETKSPQNVLLEEVEKVLNEEKNVLKEADKNKNKEIIIK